MRVSTLLVIFTLVFCAFAVLPRLHSEEEAKLLWNKFKSKHGKFYGISEEPKRFEIFKENLAKTQIYNQLSHDNIYGVTKFSDLSEEEFKSTYLMKPKSAAQLRASIPKYAEYVETYTSNGPLPESFDWREKGAVTGVKDQGACGSCWSFSTTGNIEGQQFIKNKKLVSLSEQNLVDCDHHCVTYQGEKVCDAGCGGGLMWSAMEFIKEQGGIDTEDSYPYEAYNDQCRFKNSSIGAKVTGVTMLPHTDAELAAWLIDNGPISVAMNANWLQYYTGGISNPPLCNKDALDHGVLIVGFGKGWSWLGPVNYWIVKNSWNTNWGEQGYFRVAWGKCGLSMFPSSAIVAAQ